MIHFTHLMDFSKLKEWFLNERRELPWREDASPYAVWVSEVMLQQTQVSVVIPYFYRWMECFPTIQALANAHIDEVIKAWEGLGYYSRARNLHEAANTLIKEYGGELPNNREELSKIKGLGPYTTGAILSFAFHQKATAVDGNVVRVLTRLLKIEEDISKGKTIAHIRETLEGLLPDVEPWIIGEALIELGAVICQKKPKCHLCPLQNKCSAHVHGVTDQLPIKSAKTKYVKLHRLVAIIQYQDSFLVQKGEKGKVMSDLYEFPYLEHPQNNFSKHLNLELEHHLHLSEVTHTFTKYRVKLSPTWYQVNSQESVKGYAWKTIEELESLPFSSGHRKILKNLCSSSTPITNNVRRKEWRKDRQNG